MKYIFSLILLSILSITLLAQRANDKLKISPLTGNFYIFTTFQPIEGNPFPANGMYVVTNAGVVMFDTPWDTSQFQPLLDSIKVRHNKNVVLCIATHSHDDRTAGLEFLTGHGVKTYTSVQTDEICKKRNNKRAQFLFDHDTTFTIGQYSFETFYPGQGHTPDNIVIWCGAEKILYGGCFVKSTEAESLGNLTDANLKEWGNSVSNVQRKYRHIKFIIPGHQGWKSNKSLIYTLKLLHRKKV